ncbi:MAG: helix-turn-helix transcriptional regulator [Candidatus Nanopelagicales bacterium]
MIAMRTVLGGELRRRRVAQSRTLRQVATEAQVSVGYLSEVERGHKEASSELLASICRALSLPLSALFTSVAQEYSAIEAEFARAQGVTPLRSTASHSLATNQAPVSEVEVAPAQVSSRSAA